MVFFITVIYLYPLFLWIFVIILSLNTCIKLQCKFSHIINVNTIKKARCNITNIYILVYILHKLYAFIINRLLPSVWFRFRVFIREREIFHVFFSVTGYILHNRRRALLTPAPQFYLRLTCYQTRTNGLRNFYRRSIFTVSLCMSVIWPLFLETKEHHPFVISQKNLFLLYNYFSNYLFRLNGFVKIFILRPKEDSNNFENGATLVVKKINQNLIILNNVLDIRLP